MHVDEAGSNNQPLRLDLTLGRRFGDASDRNDSIPLDRNIAVKPWIARAVNNTATSNNNVVRLRISTQHEQAEQQELVHRQTPKTIHHRDTEGTE